MLDMEIIYFTSNTILQINNVDELFSMFLDELCNKRIFWIHYKWNYVSESLASFIIISHV